MGWYLWWPLYRLGFRIERAGYRVRDGGSALILAVGRRCRRYPQWWAEEGGA